MCHPPSSRAHVMRVRRTRYDPFLAGRMPVESSFLPCTASSSPCSPYSMHGRRWRHVCSVVRVITKPCRVASCCHEAGILFPCVVRFRCWHWMVAGPGQSSSSPGCCAVGRGGCRMMMTVDVCAGDCRWTNTSDLQKGEEYKDIG